MPARLTKAEREEKAGRAVMLSARGWNLREIGEELGHDRRTISKWIEDEYARRAEHRDQDKEKAIATYEAIIAEGWQRLSELKDARSYNVSGLMNSIKAAQDSINKITGAEAPLKHEDVTPGLSEEMRDLLDAIGYEVE